MNVAGTVLLFCSVYLIGVWIGRIQAGGSRKALRKNMQWKRVSGASDGDAPAQYG